MAPELNVPISDILEALDKRTAEPPNRNNNPDLSGFVFAQDLSERGGPDLGGGLVFDSTNKRFDPATSRRLEEVAREMPKASRASRSQSRRPATRPQTAARPKTATRPVTKPAPNAANRGLFVGYSAASDVDAAPSIERPPQPKLWKNVIGLVVALLIAAVGFWGLLRVASHRSVDADTAADERPADMQGSMTGIPIGNLPPTDDNPALAAGDSTATTPLDDVRRVAADVVNKVEEVIGQMNSSELDSLTGIDNATAEPDPR